MCNWQWSHLHKFFVFQPFRSLWDFCALSSTSLAQSFLEVLISCFYPSLGDSKTASMVFTNSTISLYPLNCGRWSYVLQYSRASAMLLLKTWAASFTFIFSFSSCIWAIFSKFPSRSPLVSICSAPTDTSNWFFLLEFAMFFLQSIHCWTVSVWCTHQVLHGPCLWDLLDFKMRVSYHAHLSLLSGLTTWQSTTIYHHMSMALHVLGIMESKNGLLDDICKLFPSQSIDEE